MIKSILFAVFTVFVFSYSALSQCVSCYQSTIDYTKNASGVGQHNTATGQSSFAMGNESISIGASSGAFGINTEAHGAAGFAIGRRIKSAATSAIILGTGYNFTDYLINGTYNSLMIGFNSTAPTLFVSESQTNDAHKDRTGRIGIGKVTEPLAKLHIKADDNENAEIYLQAHVWNGSAVSTVFIGNKNHGISASGSMGLVFNSEKNYVFNNGNVGIGVEDPLERLQINGTVMTKGFRMPQDAIRAGWVLTTTDDHGNAAWVPSQSLSLWSYDEETGNIYRATGNVGIGVENPLSTLEVRGQISVGFHVEGLQENNLIVEGRIGIGTAFPDETSKLDVEGKIKTKEFQLLNGNLDGNILQCDNNGNAIWVSPSEIDDGDWKTLANNIYVENNRNVGIGTSAPTQPLDVNGNVKISGNIIGGHDDWQSLKLFAGTNSEDGS